jgi:hypothetical protein
MRAMSRLAVTLAPFPETSSAREEILGAEANELIAAADEVHRRRPEEGRHEGVRWVLVDLPRWPDLAHLPLVHDRDPVPEPHGLGLVVGHVDRGGADPLLELFQLVAGAGAQLRVEVRERLVEEENARLANERARQRDALALAARQLPRLARKQPLDAEQLGRPAGPALALLLGHLLGLEREGAVLEHGLVGVQRVALEHHRHLPRPRREAVHDVPADQDLALRRLLEPGDGAQQRGLAAARGTEQHQVLPLGGLDVHPVHGDDVAVVALLEPPQLDGERRGGTVAAFLRRPRLRHRSDPSCATSRRSAPSATRPGPPTPLATADRAPRARTCSGR